MKKTLKMTSVIPGRNSVGGNILLAGLLLVLVVSAGLLSVRQSSALHRAEPSVEVSFSSLSPSGALGGEIIPASCESGGYDHTAGRAITNIVTNNGSSPEPRIQPGGSYRASAFGNYCFGNRGSLSYLAPLRSWAEFISFWNRIGSLSGLYTIP